VVPWPGIPAKVAGGMSVGGAATAAASPGYKFMANAAAESAS
jgi:hypothetical protein